MLLNIVSRHHASVSLRSVYKDSAISEFSGWLQQQGSSLDIGSLKAALHDLPEITGVKRKPFMSALRHALGEQVQ